MTDAAVADAAVAYAIGSKLIVTTNEQETRYEGFLHNINEQETYIILRSARSLGTEGGEASSDTLGLMVFHRKDIANITVVESSSALSIRPCPPPTPQDQRDAFLPRPLRGWD